jgi:hypothetical protein
MSDLSDRLRAVAATGVKFAPLLIEAAEALDRPVPDVWGIPASDLTDEQRAVVRAVETLVGT